MTLLTPLSRLSTLRVLALSKKADGVISPLPSLTLNYPSLFLPLSYFALLLLVSLSLTFSFYCVHFCSLVLSLFHLFSTFHFPLVSSPSLSSLVFPTSLAISLFLSSRKSLSTICLTVMNSEPFRTNQLGHINETLQGDKLCVSVCVCWV